MKLNFVLTSNWRRASMLLLSLVILSGCGKSNRTEPEASAAPETELPAAAGAAPMTTPTKQRSPVVVAAAALPNLRPEVQALIASNQTAIIEHQVHYIVTAELSAEETAQALFAIYATATPSDQRKVAHAAVKYVADERFGLIREQLLNAQLAPQVLSVFLTETLKREDGIKLPVLLDLARSPGHPNQGEAQQLLAALLGKDYGANWDKWEREVQASLTRQHN